MSQEKFRGIVIVFVSLCAIALSSLAPVQASDGGGKAPNQPQPSSISRPRPGIGPFAASSNCRTSPSYAHCDGYDPPSSNCASGAYVLAGDPSYLEMFWSPNCQSNYFYTSIPSGSVCGSSICNAVEEVDFYRQNSILNSKCNMGFVSGSAPDPTKDPYYPDCVNDANGFGWTNAYASPGNCAEDTVLIYCHTKGDAQDCAYNFNNELLAGSGGSYAASWETDMLYAPNDYVAACVIYINSGTKSESRQYCTDWH